MPRISFLRDFDYRPSGAPRVVVAYAAGKSYVVKRECADLALAKGAAVLDRKASPRPKPESSEGE